MTRQFLSDVYYNALYCLLLDTPPDTSNEHIASVEILLPRIFMNARTPTQLAGAVVITTPIGNNHSTISRRRY